MQKKRNTTYARLSFLMILLIIGAVTGPQLLFLAQDSRIQEKVTVGERDSMDMSALNADYTKDIKTRLTNIAEGIKEGRNYYAYATDYEINADAYELTDKLLYKSDCFDFFFKFQLQPISYCFPSFRGYDIKCWKRYVICDEDFEGGVILMAWYFDIMLDEGMEFQFLADAEDNTLYAIRFENVENDYFAVCAYDNLIVNISDFCNDYYRAGNQVWSDLETHINTMGIDDEAVDSTSNVSKVNEKDENKSYEEKYKEIMETGSCVVSLIYGENSLNWEICLVEDDVSKKTDLYLGIREIRELIPEFSRQNN